jgi:hypothetical protein
LIVSIIGASIVIRTHHSALQAGTYRPQFLIPFAVLGIVALFFGSMTISIDDKDLSWTFGIGLLRRSVPLSDIEACRTISTGLLAGLGIRYTERGWLYNVSGRDAIAVRMLDGKQFCLGTDDASHLNDTLTKIVRTLQHRSNTTDAVDEAPHVDG